MDSPTQSQGLGLFGLGEHYSPGQNKKFKGATMYE